MITYVRASLFSSPAQTLVNTVNTVGVMGKGIAKEFKARYPKMFSAYKAACSTGELNVGRLQLWRDENHWVLNFPTKTTWRLPSELSYIEQGLETFVSSYKEMGISSISFPPLGCGNGSLQWSEVRPVMENYLRNLEIPIYIHDRQVALDYIPEHKESDAVHAPSSFTEFLADVRDQIGREHRCFRTISGRSEFKAVWKDDGIVVDRGSRTSHIRPEYMEWAWSTLQNGILTSAQYPSDESRKAKSYLFAILARLPYVKAAEVARPEWSEPTHAHGLYFDRASVMREKTHAAAVIGNPEGQLCLYQDL